MSRARKNEQKRLPIPSDDHPFVPPRYGRTHAGRRAYTSSAFSRSTVNVSRALLTQHIVRRRNETVRVPTAVDGRGADRFGRRLPSGGRSRTTARVHRAAGRLRSDDRLLDGGLRDPIRPVRGALRRRRRTGGLVCGRLLGPRQSHRRRLLSRVGRLERRHRHVGERTLKQG